MIFCIAILTLLIGELWIFLALSGPFLPFGHDVTAHLTYSKLFNEALSQGQFPVRWVEHIWDGHSMPLFNFYQTGFYYLNYLMSFITPQTTDSIKSSVMLLWLLGGVGVFLLLRKLGPIPAALAFIVYLTSPYLYLDIFVRSSFPEFMAISLLPLTLFAFRKILEGKLVFMTIFSLLFGVIIFTHLHMAIVFTPIFVIYALINRSSNIRFAALSFLLSFGVAAFYLLPAISELDLIQPEKLTSKDFDFHKNFTDLRDINSYIWGYSGVWVGSYGGWSKLIGVTQWIIWFLSLALALFKKKIFYRKEMLFWLLVLAYGLFLMSPFSTLIWENVQILRFLQFPWRFAAIFPIATATLAGIMVSELTKDLKKQVAVHILIVAVALITTYPYIVVYSKAEMSFFNLPFKQWSLNEKAKVVAYLEPAYLPKGVEELPYGPLGRYYTPDKQVNLRLEKSTDIELVFTSDHKDAFELRVFSHDFPGWRAFVDNQPLMIKDEEKTRYIILMVPPGKHIIEVKFTDTKIRQIANRVSIATLAMLFIGSVLRILIKWKRSGLKDSI